MGISALTRHGSTCLSKRLYLTYNLLQTCKRTRCKKGDVYKLNACRGICDHPPSEENCDSGILLHRAENKGKIHHLNFFGTPATTCLSKSLFLQSFGLHKSFKCLFSLLSSVPLSYNIFFLFRFKPFLYST